MKARRSYLPVIILGLFCSHSINGQTPQQQRQEETPVRLAATEVSLDIVVKDKKGRFVKDLTASDFEVYEDGVRQKVESFRLVVREATHGPAAAAEAPETAEALTMY